MHLPSVPNVAHASLSNPHQVLIIGCAYAGISTLVNLLDFAQGKGRDIYIPVAGLKDKKSKRGVEITVIDERDGYFHSVGAPLAHVTPKHTPSMWKQYSLFNELRNHANLQFKHGSVKSIDAKSKVAEWLDRSGEKQQQAYDYCIVATGLKRHWPAVPKGGSFAEYMRDSKELQQRIRGGDVTQKDRKVVVVGAGAVGVEFAGEIKTCYPEVAVTLVHSRSEVLSSEPLPSEVKEKVALMLEEEGVNTVLGNRASITELSEDKYEVTLANGSVLSANLVLDTTKKGEPTTDFLPAECLDDGKDIKVTPHLTFNSDIANAQFHFGVGDVVAWSGIKRAGGAMVMGQLAAANVYASILNSEEDADTFQHASLPEYPAVIGIAVGKQCLTYDKERGINYGVQVMKDYFQDDLGWAANLKSLQLTDALDMEGNEKQPQQARIGEVGVEAVSTAP